MGDTVVVEKGGDVIPKVVRVVLEARPGGIAAVRDAVAVPDLRRPGRARGGRGGDALRQPGMPGGRSGGPAAFLRAPRDEHRGPGRKAHRSARHGRPALRRGLDLRPEGVRPGRARAVGREIRRQPDIRDREEQVQRPVATPVRPGDPARGGEGRPDAGGPVRLARSAREGGSRGARGRRGGGAQHGRGDRGLLFPSATPRAHREASRARPAVRSGSPDRFGVGAAHGRKRGDHRIAVGNLEGGGDRAAAIGGRPGRQRGSRRRPTTWSWENLRVRSSRRQRPWESRS